MGTIVYECGCSISRGMFGNGEILSVIFCNKHSYIYSENKTNKEMVDELIEIIWNCTIY